MDRVIDAAVSHGITLFETADVYGKGAMEKKLGERLPKGTVAIATKIGTDLSGQAGAQALRAAVPRGGARSLGGRPSGEVDHVLLHNPTLTAINKGEACAFLREQKNVGGDALGRVRGVGRRGARRDREGAEVIELVYNMTLPGDLHAIADVLAERGTGVLARVGARSRPARRPLDRGPRVLPGRSPGRSVDARGAARRA